MAIGGSREHRSAMQREAKWSVLLPVLVVEASWFTVLGYAALRLLG